MASPWSSAWSNQYSFHTLTAKSKPSAKSTNSDPGRRHSLAGCISARPCTNSVSLSGKSAELDKHKFLQASPALGGLGGSSPSFLTLTEREHFWGGLLEWPSSWPCSLRNPVTWSKKEVTSNWCHSTSFWPKEQKVPSNRSSAKRCSSVVKHTNSLLQESLFEELQLPTGYHLIIMQLPPSTPLNRDRHGYRHSLFPFFSFYLWECEHRMVNSASK